MFYLYVLDGPSNKWCLNDVLSTEGEARSKGRDLWRARAAGIRIDAISTIVEEVRK